MHVLNMTTISLSTDPSFVNKLSLSLTDHDVRVTYTDENHDSHDVVVSSNDTPCKHYLSDLLSTQRNDPRALWSGRLAQKLDPEAFEWALCGGLNEMMGIICHRLVTGKPVPQTLDIDDSESGDVITIQTWKTENHSRQITNQNVFFGNDTFNSQEQILESLI